MGLFDHLDLVGALHQLVDLRGHRPLDDRQQRSGVDLGVAPLRTADVKCSESPLVMGGDRHAVKDDLDLALLKTGPTKPLAGATGDELLRTRTGGHPSGGDPDQPTSAARGGHRTPVERVDLLRAYPRDRRWLVLGVARRDRHLGALGLLTITHQLGDLLGERLGPEGRLFEDYLADRFVDDLLEARHVRPLLMGAKVYEAVEPREKQLVANTDHLLHAGDAGARESKRHRRPAGLDVARQARVAGLLPGPRRRAHWRQA